MLLQLTSVQDVAIWTESHRRILNEGSRNLLQLGVAGELTVLLDGVAQEVFHVILTAAE